LQEAAALLFKTPKRDLESQGRLFNNRFIAEHTWENRWRQLVEGRELRSEVVHLPFIAGKPFPVAGPLVRQSA
jgi:hypothetical protein